MTDPQVAHNPVVPEGVSFGQRAAIVAARTQWAVGVSGVCGAILLIAASALLLNGWREQRTFERQSTVTAASPLSAAESAVLPLAPPQQRPVALPGVRQVPVLLERLERAAIAEGIGWSRADYRISDASTDHPAALEVRCSLKATYPALRRFVSAILRDTPALTFRELSFSRAATTESTVDARLTVVVYLDAPTAAETGRVVTSAASAGGAR